MLIRTLLMDPSGEGGSPGGDGGSQGKQQGGDGEGAKAKASGDGGTKEPTKTEPDPKAEKAVRFYENLNQRYNSDKAFREGFDALVQGKKQAQAQDQANSGEGGDEGEEDFGDEQATKKKPAPKKKGSDGELADMVAKQSQTIDELKKELGKLRGTVDSDFVARDRSTINSLYQGKFAELAEEHGWARGSSDYTVLLRNTISIAKDLAGEYDLIGKTGEPDLLSKYEQKVLEKAFKKADEELRGLGVDPVARRDEFKRKQEEAKEKKENKEIDEIIKPDNLKTQEARANALDRAFKVRMRQLGVKPKDLRLA